MFSHLKLWLDRLRGSRRGVQGWEQEAADEGTSAAQASDENFEGAKPKLDKLAEVVRAHMTQ